MSAAARYHARAPRYVFRHEDESWLRFAPLDTRAQKTHARIRDLSATGLLIAVASDQVPPIGDLIKIEFCLPGGKRVARFAQVARVETKNEWDPDLGDRTTTFVGLRFHDLPPAFREAIQISLQSRLKTQANNYEAEYEKTEPRDATRTSEQERTMLIAMSLIVLTLFGIMSLPLGHWFG